MTSDRFHKAAKDGLLDVLREASRKECNNRDESGMTPTLWAAFEGHLEALRLLCARGGDPDKADQFGNTALHLAAARGHRECVAFLVKFGASVHALDVDGHAPHELAAINGKDDILRYLDHAAAKLELTDKKKAKSLKEKAKKEHEKLLKQYQKQQTKAELMAEKELKKLAKEYDKDLETNGDYSTMTPKINNDLLTALKMKMKRSSSQGNLLVEDPARPTYSALVGTLSAGSRGRSTVQKKALASKMRNGTLTRNGVTEDFKVGQKGSVGRTTATLNGVRRDSEVMYVGTLGAGNRTRADLADVFVNNDTRSTLTRCNSQPDFLAEQRTAPTVLREPASIFDRPGFGSVAFRRSITATLGNAGAGEEVSIGSAGSLAARQQPPYHDRHSESSTITSDDEDPEESSFASLERFLTAWGLAPYVQKFKEEQIDLDALMLLTESDLKTLGLPLGPYRKLMTAVNERKQALAHPGPLIDTGV